MNIVKVTILTAFYCGIKKRLFADPAQAETEIIKLVEGFTEHVEKNGIRAEYMLADELHNYLDKQFEKHHIMLDHECPDCHYYQLKWQKTPPNYIECTNCGRTFDNEKALKILDACGKMDGNTHYQFRPVATHKRIKGNPYKAARKALSKLTLIGEHYYGTVTNPSEDMSCRVQPNEHGVWIAGNYNSQRVDKTLAEALHNNLEISYNDGWIILEYADGVLYVDFCSWTRNKPYLEHKIDIRL